MAEPDITALLHSASAGHPEAMEQLFAALYDRLRALAARHLRDERPDHTLGPTGLVHETFLKLVDTRAVTWEGQAHFFKVAAQAMRRILVDHARRRGAAKRERARDVSLPPDLPAPGSASFDEILAVDDALSRLAHEDERAGRLVELRYFGGMSVEECAQVLGVSPATAKREWAFARGWLQHALGGRP